MFSTNINTNNELNGSDLTIIVIVPSLKGLCVFCVCLCVVCCCFFVFFFLGGGGGDLEAKESLLVTVLILFLYRLRFIYITS